MLEVSNLKKQYKDYGKHFVAIKDISFTVKKGEILCIVGLSGSGKSTILRCITGIEKNYGGTITIKRKKSFDYFKKDRIALVPQKYSNFPWLTVYENIAIGFYGKNYSEAKIEGLVKKLLKRVGLYKFKDSYMNKLSGGMQQRVAIARAIAQETDVIAFDEPFGALDVQTRAQMQEFLSKLWEEEQKTMILVTHDIDEAIYLADRIIILGTNPGTIKEVVDVKIKRPRKPEIRFHEDFVKVKKYINYTIRSESIKASLEEGGSLYKDVIKLGLIIWSGNIPFYYAKDSEMYTDEQIEVEQISFDDNQKKIDYFIQGKLDIINVTLDKAIELQKKIPDLKILGILNQSVGGDALVAQKNITSVKGLRGKTVGLEKGSPGEFFLTYALHKEGMTYKDVKIRDMKCSEIGSSIISGNIDGGVLWEPWLDKVCKFSDINVLKTTKDYAVLYDVLIIRKKIFDKKKDDFLKVIKIWKKAVSKLKSQKGEVISTTSSHTGIPERELLEFTKKVMFLKSTPKCIFDIAKDIGHTLIKVGVLDKYNKPESMFLKNEKRKTL